MPSYNIIEDFEVSETDAEESLQSAPDWCVVVFRFQNPLTYDRAKQGSFSTIYSDGVRVRGGPLIIRDEVRGVSVTSTKTNHLTQMSAALLPNAKVNFLSEIMPGDWVFAWMAHKPSDIDAVIKKVKDGKAANGFSDGLKFMGRIVSCRKVLEQAAQGPRRVHYNVTAAGFSEFDATLFYEPHLAENIPAIGQYFAALGAHINKLIDEQGQGIDVNKALRLFLDLLLGQGITKNLGLPTGDASLNSTAGLDAPYSYVVPKEVGAVIGKTDKSKPDLLSAADCIEFVYGRQEYEEQEFTDDEMALLNTEEGQQGTLAVIAGQRLNPKGTKGGGNRRFTGNDMLGIFLPTPPQFSNHSVWSILNQYLNPAVNEMYTCLRVNPQGRVVPTLVARQLPFSTELAPSDPPVTKFLSLPRWVVHPILVKRADIGRSDSLRINFVHVYGDDGPQSMNPVAGQIVLAPPYRDDLDIARSGLKPHMQTVSNAPQDNVTGESAKKWMAILSDILMGQQLTLTGLIEIFGVQAPICPGDNIEFDGAVFHIESVTHSCAIENGTKSFTTTLALSHGLSADPGNDNLSLFAGVESDDFRSFEPGLTNDTLNEPTGGGDSTPATEAGFEAGVDLSSGVA